jgi:Conserved hypothetical phage protein (DUF2376).
MHPLAREDEVVLRHPGHVVVLRPSLRAAVTLERLHGDWSGLLLCLDQTHLATVQALIRASAVNRNAAEALLSSFQNLPIREIKEAVIGPLSDLMALFLAPMTEERAGEPKPTNSKPKPWSDAYAELFRFGTGWLGWTPADTWAATPTEIAQALEGKVAMMIAMNGGPDETDGTSSRRDHTGAYSSERLKEIDELGYDPAFDRAALQSLKAKHQ